MSENRSKATIAENIVWVSITLAVDFIAIALKLTALGYVYIGAPLQAFTGVVISYYFLVKGDVEAFRLKKQAKRIVLQVLPIPLITTGMYLYLTYRHNRPKITSLAEGGIKKATQIV